MRNSGNVENLTSLQKVKFPEIFTHAIELCKLNQPILAEKLKTHTLDTIIYNICNNMGIASVQGTSRSTILNHSPQSVGNLISWLF